MKKKYISIILFLHIAVAVCGYEGLIISGNIRADLFHEDGEGGLLSIAKLLHPSHLYIDCGNISDTNKYTMFDKGEKYFALLYKMGLKILVPGNHELDYGRDRLDRNLKDIKLLSANTDLGVDHHIAEISGKKIGLIGLTRDDLCSVIMKETGDSVKLFDIRESVRKSVDKISSECDTILLFSNTDEKVMRDLLKEIPEISHGFVNDNNHMNKLDFIKSETIEGKNIYRLARGAGYVFRGDYGENGLEFKVQELGRPADDVQKIINEKFNYDIKRRIDDSDRFLTSVFSSFRAEYRTDLVLVNSGVFSMDSEDFEDFLRYDNSMHKVRIRGKVLKRVSADPDFLVYGLKDNRIFGRNINEHYQYLVLVNDFLYGHRGTFNIPQKLVEKNVIPSVKTKVRKEFKNYSQETDYFRMLKKVYHSVTTSYSKDHSRGDYRLYPGVSQLVNKERKEFKLRYFYNDSYYLKNRLLTNNFEFRYETSDNETDLKNVRLNTKLDYSDRNLVFYQKIDTSLLKNTLGDQPTNYRFSVGKTLKSGIYAGISYQQIFPEHGRDPNIGLQLTYSDKEKMKRGIRRETYADIFYSDNNDEYYEIELINSIRIPVNRLFNLEFRMENFIISDEGVAGRAYNSTYFLGINHTFSFERLTG
ncbi:MAG: hypothetical protein ACOCWO_04450 [Candidatus Muiribacteriaceae bacterium]